VNVFKKTLKLTKEWASETEKTKVTLTARKKGIMKVAGRTCPLKPAMGTIHTLGQKRSIKKKKQVIDERHCRNM